MPFGLQTAGKIASAPFKLVGGIGKQLLNVLPFDGKKTKGKEAKRQEIQQISRVNLPSNSD